MDFGKDFEKKSFCAKNGTDLHARGFTMLNIQGTTIY
jgi:hypothetical protein